jgi:hypothetical protein
MTLFDKICRMVGDRRIPSFRMPAFKRFSVGFANRHVTTIVVMAIMVSAAAVSVGLYFAIKDVASSTYNWPEPAEYQVTADGLQTMGKKNPDYPDGTESQTLSIRLGDGVRISTLRIKDSDVGRAGIAKALDISPVTTAVTGALAYLWVGNLTITNSSFPTLAWQNSEVGTLNTGMLCDGHTMSATVSNTIPDLELSSERLASVYEVDSTIVDRIQIHITGNNGAYVDNLIIDNLDAWNGAASFDRLKIGTATINNSNRIGDGTGVDSASCVIGSSVSSRIINNTMQDRPIKVR